MPPQSASIRPSAPPADPDARLTSWKEIAQFFDRDVRTVKRWEKSRRLPVHRLPGVRGGVYAFVHELQEWQKLPEPEDLIDDIDIGPESDSGADDSEGEAEAEVPRAEVPRASLLTLVPRDARIPWQPDSRQDTADFPAPQPEPAPLESAPARLGPASPGPALPSTGWQRRVSLAAVVVLLLCGGIGAWRSFHKPGLRHNPSPDARELYLKGRYYWDKRTAADLNTAQNYFEQAIAKDPNYASAFASLADTYYLMREFGTLPDDKAFPAAIDASRRALALEPDLADAHRSYAFGSFYWTWDRMLAETEFRRAIQLKPDDALTHHWFANMLMECGRYAEASTEIAKARDLEPTSKALLADRALLLINEGRSTEAVDSLRSIENDDPSFLAPHRYLAGWDLDNHQTQAFVTEMQTIASMSKSAADKELAAAVSSPKASQSEAEMLDAFANAQINLYRKGQASAFNVADSLARAGRDEEALRYLELSYANHDSTFLLVPKTATFARIRNSPQFMELVKRSQEPYKQLSTAPPDIAALPPH